MLYFSYNDYVDLTEDRKIDGLLKVEEKRARYIAINKDKKDIQKGNIIQFLRDNQEMIKFIKDFLDIDFIDGVTICNNIKIDIDKCEANNVLYKVDNKNIYLFIKQVENIDINISFKILEYCLKIMKTAKKSESTKINPIIMPIVIYTGKEEWKLRSTQNNNKIRYTNYFKNRVNLAYNVISANDFSVEELKNKQSKVANEFFKINIYK